VFCVFVLQSHERGLHITPSNRCGLLRFLGAYLLMLAQHKLTKQRHEVMFKGLVFIHRYLTLRRGGLSEELTKEAVECIEQAARGLPVAGTESNSALTAASATPTGTTQLSAAQEHEILLFQESCYNLGRALHDMLLPHLACAQYTQALALAERYDFLRREGASVITRSAAHNLVQIYKRSGSKDMALEVMQQFLTM
jgi:hypothetical protein